MLRQATAGSQPIAAIRLPRSIGWLPLLVLPLCAAATRTLLPPWAFMWTLALAIYAACKWLTWWRVRNRAAHPPWRSSAYLLAWPGMDAETFLDTNVRVPPPRLRAWFIAGLETSLGAVLLWGAARSVPASHPLLRGWTGMLGAIFLLHFGIFQVLALFWQTCGVDAPAIMAAPLRSTSLSEFWGKRWNLGFHQLAHDGIFAPLHRRLGTFIAGWLVFAVSGLVHDLLISIPARAGYGLPTAYFLLQGAGVALERTAFGKKLGLRRGWRGWLFMAACTAGPAFLLFHPAFVTRVIVPFMKAIRAL